MSRRCQPAFLVRPGGWYALPPAASGGGGRARCPLPPLPPGFTARPACGGSGAVPCRAAASPPSLVFWGSWFAPLAAWRAAPACPGVRPSSVRASLAGGRRSLRCGFALRPARGSPGPPWGARPAGFGGAGAPCAGAMRGLAPPLFAPRPGAVSPRARARRCLSGLAGGVPLPLWLAGLCSASGGCAVAGGRGAAVRPALRPQEGRLCPYPPRPFPRGERGAQGRWPPLRGVSWGRRVVKGKRPCRGLRPP